MLLTNLTYQIAWICFPMAGLVFKLLYHLFVFDRISLPLQNCSTIMARSFTFSYPGIHLLLRGLTKVTEVKVSFRKGYQMELHGFTWTTMADPRKLANWNNTLSIRGEHASTTTLPLTR